jgi:Fe-S-cluster containining protein
MPGPKRALPVLQRLSEPTIASAVAEGVYGVLAEGEGPVETAAQVFAWFEQILQQVEAKIPPTRERACKEGCSYCCHLKVAITPLEALRLSSQLRATLDPAALAVLKQRVEQADERTHGQSTEARVDLKVPCPLLGEEGRCIAYEARPLSCAGANSYDMAQCRAAHEASGADDASIEHYGLQVRTAAAVRDGSAHAVSAAGADGRVLELIAALRIVLEDPDAKAKWLAHQPVFVSALDDEFQRQ